MKNFEYIYPKTIESIPAILASTNGKSLLYAGGTDALSRIKEGLDSPEQLVNLKSVKELKNISEDSDGLHLGAGALLADIVENSAVQKYAGLVRAAQSIGTPQLRNMGTLGGNLCQRPRCWYYRSRHFHCARKEGEICFAVNGRNKYHAILGGESCFIVYPSDLAPMLIALDAKVKILGPAGEREIPLADLYLLPSQDILKETVLKSQELITEVIVPPPSGKSHYLKFKERKSFDFALVSVALSANISANRVSNVKIVLGGVAPKPWQAKKAENALEGKEASNYNVEQAAAAEMEDAVPLTENAYKVILAKNLIRQAFRELLG